MTDLENNGLDIFKTDDWISINPSSIITSKGNYEMRLRAILNTCFSYYLEEMGQKNSDELSQPEMDDIIMKVALNKLLEDIEYSGNESKRITLQKIVTILEKMHEVERVEIKKIKEGRKIVNATLHIYSTKGFINTMIENNSI